MPDVEKVAWESRPETTEEMVEEFKVYYADPAVKMEAIGERFGLSAHTVGNVARRLGMPPRRPKVQPISEVNSSLRSLEEQEALLEAQLDQVRRKKQDLEVRVVREEGTITLYGLGEPITRSIMDVVYWLKAGGPIKLREKIRQEEWER